MAESGLGLKVQVVYSPAPRSACIREVDWTEQLSARQVLMRSGLLSEHPELQSGDCLLGVWGRKVAATHVMCAGDRLEVYRPLQVDPKKARRERFKKQGAKTAGLFNQRRAGAKAGY